ncbi:MAG: polysaccharide deacetylase family protein [Lentisphaerota bacterium]
MTRTLQISRVKMRWAKPLGFTPQCMLHCIMAAAEYGGLACLLWVLTCGQVSIGGELDAGVSRITKWKNDKHGVLLLTFDDSLSTQIDNVVPELKKRNLAGTFYINPGTQRWEERQSSWEKTFPQEFPAFGMEYGNHTFTHHGAKDTADFDEEIGKCNDVILKLFPAKQPHLISYALPGVPKQDWNITANQENEILAKHHLVRRPEYVIADNSGYYNSVDRLLALANVAIAQGSVKCIVFHGVGGDHHIADMPMFTEFLDKLAAKRDQLWITTAIPAHKYSIERDGANIKVLQSDDRQIRLQLTSKADTGLYDYPLTLISRVPATWKQCRIIQGVNQFSCQSVSNSIMFDALPNGELITIQRNLENTK